LLQSNRTHPQGNNGMAGISWRGFPPLCLSPSRIVWGWIRWCGFPSLLLDMYTKFILWTENSDFAGWFKVDK
jgi:hypothetical protein